MSGLTGYEYHTLTLDFPHVKVCSQPALHGCYTLLFPVHVATLPYFKEKKKTFTKLLFFQYSSRCFCYEIEKYIFFTDLLLVAMRRFHCWWFYLFRLVVCSIRSWTCNVDDAMCRAGTLSKADKNMVDETEAHTINVIMFGKCLKQIPQRSRSDLKRFISI